MKALRLPLIILSSLLIVPTALQAAQVNLRWQEPESYRDIRAGGLGSEIKFQKQVIDELGEYIQEAANKYLAPNQQLNMTVTDIDLAGDVQYFFTRFPEGVRVVSNLYFPSIEFTYELLDVDNKVTMSGEENVKDIGFQFSGSRVVREAPLGYEKRMIDEWFRATFSNNRSAS